MGLLNELKKYIKDALPGGLLNPEVNTQGILDGAALSTTAVPVLGDLLGLGADLHRYKNEPESRTLGNFALSGLGMLPFVPAMTAWHGSPHKFDKFSTSAIGSEQGGKLFGGRGFSLADNPDDAKAYGENLYKVDIPDSGILDTRDKGKFIQAFGDLKPIGSELTLKQMVDRYQKAAKETKIEDVHLEDLGNGFKGIQWKVNGDWKSPVNNRVSSLELSNDTSGMAYALRAELPRNPDEYFNAASFSPSEITEAAKMQGYIANKIDGSIGHRGDEFTVFDPEMIRILERNGVPTGQQPWKPGEWQGLLGR